MFWTLITPEGTRKETLCDSCAIKVINISNDLVKTLCGVLNREPLFPQTFDSMAEFLVSLEAEKAIRPEVAESWKTEFESSPGGICGQCHLAYDGAA